MAATVPTLGQTRTLELDTDPVCAFYTAHPYPPPVDNLDRARDEWRDSSRHRAEYHLLWPDRPYRADLDILVAGCGTWQAARYAVCRPASRITGIDVSATSIDHTEVLKRKYGLTNLELRQLPIEQVGTLDRRFDLVVCTGVLHHLADPDAGLRALRAVLNTDGAMHLMVYGRYGRTGIYMLQEYCRRLGLKPTHEEVGDLMAALEALSSQHPAATLLRHARDAHDADALADALLHPRDRSYSVPELFDLIERNGLEFGRWLMQAPYSPRCGAVSATPHASRLGALSERDQYAALELWRGTIAHHSVVVHRRGPSRAGVDVQFDGDAWLRYIPLRRHATVCIRERLPVTASAVLLNRGHLHHDLILPIDAGEKQMLDAIDGRRTIAEIVEIAGGRSVSSRAPAFFEKLWWYDQVVFDASRSA